jgi:ATP-binding cassette subfamily B protein
MKILWQYLSPQKGLIIVSLLLAGIAQLLTLTDPLIFGKIIDDYAVHPGAKTEQELVQGVVFWLLVAVGIALAARLIKSFQEYMTRLVVQKFGKQIFNDGLKQTLRLSFQEFEAQRSGETLSTLQKVRTDTERFINAFVNILFSSLTGVGFLIWYAVTKHWLLIPVFLIGIVVLGGLTGLLSKRIKTIQRSINRETNQMSGAITESLRNIELVKSLGLTFPEIRRLRDHTEKIFDLEIEKVKKVRMLSFMQSAALTLLRQSILFILLWLIFRHVLTTGELISMQFISTTIFGPLQDLGNIILSYREAEASLSSFDRLMQKPVEKSPADPVPIGPLRSMRFEHVIFRHSRSGVNAVDNISFDLKRGDTVAFVGPSGSGKSTLVKLLVGLYRPVQGKIFFNDIPSTAIRYNEMRRQIGFVTQETQLFFGSIKENLLFVKPDATDEEIVKALEQASCNTLLSRSAEGIHTMLGEGGMKLSGGEKQRIAIARALLRHPHLLIFDEATSALDSLTEESITATIKAISEQRDPITILIAHRLSTIMHADTIYVLEKGKIVESGTHDSLVEKKGLYYALWRQQIGERRADTTNIPG